MIRKNLIIAVAALGLALTGSASIADAAAPKAPKAAPTATAPKMSDAEMYAKAHAGAVAVLTQFKTVITTVPDITSALTQLPTEMAKLPALEQAYVSAKNAGKEDDAKKAADAYTAEINTILGIAAPVDMGISQLKAQVMGGFDQLGPIGAKLKTEKDVAKLLADIDTTLKPLDDADKLLEPLLESAMKNAKVRLQAEQKKIISEEINNAVGNALQQKLAQ